MNTSIIGNWMRTDIPFDLPMRTYTVQSRSNLGCKFHSGLKEGMTPNELAEYVKQFVCACRPELDCLRMVPVRMLSPQDGFTWYLTVCHPDLPAVPWTESPPIERLELCPSCSKPLGQNDYMRVVNGHTEVVCCQECVNGD